MDAPLQLRVQRYGWDKAAEHYERFWARQLQPAQDRLLARAALQPGESVLDVACGTGLVTLRALQAVGATGRVVGTDLSSTMVARAQAEAPAGAPIEYRQMNAEKLDLPEQSFDVGLCSLGLMYVPDPPSALAALYRVVRPGGRIVAAVWGARPECGWAEIFPIVERRVASDVCPLFFQLGGRSALADLMSTTGLEQVQWEHFSTLLHYDTAEDALGAAFAGGPVALAYSRFDDAMRESAHAEYLASIAEYRKGEEYNIPGAFVVASATRPRN